MRAGIAGLDALHGSRRRRAPPRGVSVARVGHGVRDPSARGRGRRADARVARARRRLAPLARGPREGRLGRAPSGSRAERVGVRVRERELPGHRRHRRGRARASPRASPRSAAVESAVARSVRWMIGMRSKNGAWGAFDADNVQALCRDIPFCDFGEVIDRPDRGRDGARDRGAREGRSRPARGHEAWQRVAARCAREGRLVVRTLGRELRLRHGRVAHGARRERREVERSPAVRSRGEVARVAPEPDGGWGEDVRSYDDPKWAGVGDSTASQTAWALLGLVAVRRARVGTRARRRLLDSTRRRKTVAGTSRSSRARVSRAISTSTTTSIVRSSR